MNNTTSSYNSINCSDTTYKLLMVDDSKTFNQKITDASRDVGHEVVQSYSLEQTKKLVESEEFDFILLDLILPDGEGDQFLDIMPDEFKAKVIILSADTDIQRRNHIFESGILDYFSKSNPTHLIIQDIKNLLNYFLSAEYRRKRETKKDNKLNIYENNYKEGLSNIEELLEKEDNKAIVKILNLVRIGAVKHKLIDIVKITISFQKELGNKNYQECKKLLSELNKIDIVKG
ncbi:MAG: response regulator [Campylobacterota bacterium]|nr:response regulator [Campylobacterota bacterium]